MRGKEYLQTLIDKGKKDVIYKEELKGLSDKELRTLVEGIVPGGNTMKATIYSSTKNHI